MTATAKHPLAPTIKQIELKLFLNEHFGTKPKRIPKHQQLEVGRLLL